jgi:DNA-binding Lrp family transcriptional regulator
MLKLLDYGKPNPFGQIIGKPRHLAWPVNAYRVTLPRRAHDCDGLNAFERVILKLLAALGLMSDQELANETGIPLDLVRGILLRLQDKKLIDGSHALIEQEHDSTDGDHEKPPVFVTALVFRELVTGKYLPFVHRLDSANPLQTREGEEGLVRVIRADDEHKMRYSDFSGHSCLVKFTNRSIYEDIEKDIQPGVAGRSRQAGSGAGVID